MPLPDRRIHDRDLVERERRRGPPDRRRRLEVLARAGRGQRLEEGLRRRVVAVALGLHAERVLVAVQQLAGEPERLGLESLRICLDGPLEVREILEAAGADVPFEFGSQRGDVRPVDVDLVRRRPQMLVGQRLALMPVAPIRAWSPSRRCASVSRASARRRRSRISAMKRSTEAAKRAVARGTVVRLRYSSHSECVRLASWLPAMAHSAEPVSGLRQVGDAEHEEPGAHVRLGDHGRRAGPMPVLLEANALRLLVARQPAVGAHEADQELVLVEQPVDRHLEAEVERRSVAGARAKRRRSSAPHRLIAGRALQRQHAPGGRELDRTPARRRRAGALALARAQAHRPTLQAAGPAPQRDSP